MNAETWWTILGIVLSIAFVIVSVLLHMVHLHNRSCDHPKEKLGAKHKCFRFKLVKTSENTFHEICLDCGLVQEEKP